MYNSITTWKAITRSIIDFCILPGTSGGVEIVWLYTLQWKSRVSLIALTMVSLALCHIQMGKVRVSSPTEITELENTK